MRERLVATFVGMTIIVLALFAVPRAYAVANLVQDQETATAERSADLIVLAVEAREESGRPVNEEFLGSLADEGESLTFVDRNGVEVTAGTPTDDSAVTRAIGTESLTYARSDSLVSERVAEALLPVVLTGLVLAAGAALVGVVVARRMSRPFRELADAAEQIGDGRFDVEIPHYSIPEAEELGGALRGAAVQIDGLLTRERDIAVTASHELRTPITALRLSLEDMTLWKDTPADVVDELNRSIGELDRLNAAVTDLLDDRRGGDRQASGEHDLVALAARVVERWKAENPPHDITVTGDPVRTRLDVTTVSRVLDAMLTHAALNGSGSIVVEVASRDATVRFTVADESERLLVPGVVHSDTDSQLASAAHVAESIGGILGVEDADRTRLVLVLPAMALPTIG